MAWALQLDGVNDYVLIEVDSAGNDWSFEFKFASASVAPSGWYRGFGGSSNGDTSNRILINNSLSKLVYVRNSAWNEWNGLTLNINDVFRIESDANGMELFVNNVSNGFKSTSTGAINLGRVGVNYNSYSDLAVEYINFTDNLDASRSRNYDASASDHSGSTDQPILIDTIGGNNATGVNFPSFDSSVWVDLGGGGSTYEESCTYNSISALTNSNNLVMSESLTMAADSGLNKQIQLAFDASISLISSGDIVSSATIDYETAISYSSVASVNLQNTAVMMSSLAMSSSSGLIASLGNLINESLSLGQSAGLSASAQIDISGLISFDANANIQTSGNVNFNASLAMAVSAGMAVVNQAIFEAGLDLSAISAVEMTQSGAIVNVTTPSSRTFKIEISANEFTIATRDNVFTIPKRVK